MTFYHLWQDEWTKSNPPPINPRVTQSPAHGAMLHQSLFLLENRPGIKNKLKQAVLRTSKPKTKDCALENNDENLRVKPRSFVFPEADQEGLNIFCYVDVPLPKVCNAPILMQVNYFVNGPEKFKIIFFSGFKLPRK